MNLDLYKDILSVIHNHKGYTKDLSHILEQKYPNVLKGSLFSIISNECQKLTRRCNHKSTEVSDKLFTSYMQQREAQEDLLLEYELEGLTVMNLDHKKILRLSTKYNIPATLVSRVILAKFYETEENNEVKKPSKRAITDMLSNSSTIDDTDLSIEVYWSTLYDDQYSPLTDFMKQQVGYEYELRLRYFCTLEKLTFKDERALRKEGYDKTPDIKLDLPILVNGVAIMWIESKALFADDDIHQSYVRDQYLSYWNRWGPGLVIYWFGFTEDVISSSEKRFIIMANFPSSENITHLDVKLLQDQKLGTKTTSSYKSHIDKPIQSTSDGVCECIDDFKQIKFE